MAKKNNSDSTPIRLIAVGLCLFILFQIFKGVNVGTDIDNPRSNPKALRILSSYENAPMEKEVTKYAKKNKKDVEFVYKGDLDIVEELNNHSKNYDAVWISNSMWLYMLNNTYLTSDSKSLSISPVVFGIKKNG